MIRISANDRLTVAEMPLDAPQFRYSETLGDKQTLSDAEQQELATIASPQRQLGYAASRWLGKQVIASYLLHGVCPHQIQILSRDAAGHPIRPVVAIEDSQKTCKIAISHNNNRVLVAIGKSATCEIGCDLETVRTINSGFQDLWFSSEEQDWIASWPCVGLPNMLHSEPHRPSKSNVDRKSIFATAVWSAKESAFKALNQGESFAPRRFRISPSKTQTWQCDYRHGNIDKSCSVSVLISGDNIRTIATNEHHVPTGVAKASSTTPTNVLTRLDND